MSGTGKEELKYTTFDTRLGWIGILASEKGLQKLTFPQVSLEDVNAALGNPEEKAIRSPAFFEDLTERMRKYFSGYRVAFPDRLDLSRVSSFQRQVWEATRLIPYGETRSYSWLAGQIGKPGAARAVGQALSRNPLPIIVPCHRVLGNAGNLCGFRGGLEMKQYLLKLEA